MSQLQATLNDLGLQEYYNRFIEYGFDSLDYFVDVSEEDFAALGVKLGHRRRLQREVARRLGQAAEEPLVVAPATVDTTKQDDVSSPAQSQSKRKYRRRSAPDPHAPIKPDTAYVAYIKFMRQDPDIANLPFVEIAKLLGYRWSHLSCKVKGVWVQNAAAQKTAYESALAQYHQTEEYRTYRDNQKSRPQTGNPSSALLKCSFLWGGSDTSARDGISKTEESLTPSLQTNHELAYRYSVSSASTARTFNSADTSLLCSADSPSVLFGSTNTNLNVPFIEIIKEIVSQEQATNPSFPLIHLSYNDLLPSALQLSTLSNNLYVRTIEPFGVQTRAMTQTTMKRFLQNINTIYYLVNPTDLWKYLNSALDAKVGTPKLTMALVCICLALGCQTCPTGTADMAVMWYENSRRYLDEQDWDRKPAVMQILALVSMYYMNQWPATSNHYLNAAMRIGEANGFHRVAGRCTEPNACLNAEWLNIWDTMKTLQRISSLGSSVNEMSLRTWEALSINLNTNYNERIAQSTLATVAFSSLSDILGRIQQELGHTNNMPIWRSNLFKQELEAWLHYLPCELSLPLISGTGRVEQWKNTFSEATDAHRSELLHIHSLYLGTMNLLKCPSLQQVASGTGQPTSSVEEIERSAYECLSSAFQLIDLCTAYFSTSSHAAHVLLPGRVLFTSSLACVFGIIWQRQILACNDATCHNWLGRSNQSLLQTLDVFKHCAIGEGQFQRYYLVLQRISTWLEIGT